MTYEEKLDTVLNAIREAGKATRKGHSTRLHITKENGLEAIDLNELHDFLLQLQDDEEIITVHDIPTNLKPMAEQTNDAFSGKKTYFLIDILDTFEIWYENRVLERKSRIENLDWVNLLKVLDVVLDINQQLQIAKGKTVFIPSLPQMVRFPLLFPSDSIGTRKIYQQYRMEGSRYLKKIGVALEVKYVNKDMFSYGEIQIEVNLLKFEDFNKRILEEYKTRNKSSKTTGKPKATPLKATKTTESKVVWPNDFRWEGEKFVFGKYGSISFTSKDRKHILRTLTDKRGGWATINELQGSKDAGYVRSTIKQIEDRLPKEARKHIEIVSTQDDDSIEKPQAGAYRIKVKP